VANAELVSVNFRNVPAEYRDRLTRAATLRGWTIAEYMCRLMDLHDVTRALADTTTSDGRWEQVATELESLGLQSVRE